jgi:O-acetyl-ADP-ribose deacetylase (regulator of RNase III)
MAAPTGGLCDACRYCKRIVSGRGSTFRMCLLHEHDARYAKYPPIPVLRCGGYEERATIDIELVRGDITREETDAIVNAANSSLLGGGGVDGAIHHAGGPSILEECRRIRRDVWPEGLPTGRAVATGGGALRAKWVIHTVGPIYGESPDPPGELAACHASSLAIADQIGARSVSFPAISTGVYGYPRDEAALVALRAVCSARTSVRRVRFVLFGDAALAAFQAAERELTR